jgi:uncharacterized protein
MHGKDMNGNITSFDGAPKFICDVHLGRLARFLRLLGFDTVYRNDLEDDEIIRIARAEQRVALTRDNMILSRKTIRSHCPRSIHPDEQITEIISAFVLQNRCRPFTRCLDCNSEVTPVDKDKVLDRVPPRSGRAMEQFWQCSGCGKIYWRGTHYDKMKKRAEGWLVRS